MGGATAVSIVDPVDPVTNEVLMYDTKEFLYRTARSSVSSVVLGVLQTLLALYYYQAYTEQLAEYKRILDRMTDIVEIKHRWYVDRYDANRDRVHAYLNSFPEYPINYATVVGAMAFANGRLNRFASCSKSLQEHINSGNPNNAPSKRIDSALVSSKAHMLQRRLRDVEALEYAYDVQRMNNKNKANRFGAQEFTNSMQYFQNSANHRQTLMQMASSNYSGNMTGALYHLDHLTNGRTQSRTSFDNPSDDGLPPVYEKSTMSPRGGYDYGGDRRGDV